MAATCTPQPQNSTAKLDNLPPEVMRDIWTLLPRDDIARCARVNKAFGVQAQQVINQTAHLTSRNIKCFMDPILSKSPEDMIARLQQIQDLSIDDFGTHAHIPEQQIYRLIAMAPSMPLSRLKVHIELRCYAKGDFTSWMDQLGRTAATDYLSHLDLHAVGEIVLPYTRLLVRAAHTLRTLRIQDNLPSPTSFSAPMPCFKVLREVTYEAESSEEDNTEPTCRLRDIIANAPNLNKLHLHGWTLHKLAAVYKAAKLHVQDLKLDGRAFDIFRASNLEDTIVAGTNLIKLHISGLVTADHIDALPKYLPYLQGIKLDYLPEVFVRLLDVLVDRANLPKLQTIYIAVVDVPANFQHKYRELRNICQKRGIHLVVGKACLVPELEQ